MWTKNSGKISLLTYYRIFWYPLIRYKVSPIYHWVSKLSQKLLLKVKKWDETENKRLHVIRVLHFAFYTWPHQWEFSIHTSLTFQWLVQINQYPFTLPVKAYCSLWLGVWKDIDWFEPVTEKSVMCEWKIPIDVVMCRKQNGGLCWHEVFCSQFHFHLF